VMILDKTNGVFQAKLKDMAA